MAEQEGFAIPYIPLSYKEAELAAASPKGEGAEKTTSSPQQRQSSSGAPATTQQELEEHKERFLAHFFAMADEFKQEMDRLEETERDILATTKHYLQALRTRHQAFFKKS